MSKLAWTPWHQVVQLRDDIKSGELSMAIFAADLYDVVMEKAKPVYQIPSEFFALTYPTAIDSTSTLYSPVDAFSTVPLETTTAGTVLVGDTTISVVSTAGYASSYGVLSINDELVVYTGKNATQFTGCQRGAFGTAAV